MLVSARHDSWATALRALRARQWWYFALLPAAPPELGLGARLWGALVAALALGYAYGLNAQSDRATDLDAGKNPLVGASSSLLSPLLGAIGVAALGLGALAGPVSLGAVAGSLAASTMYSVGPRWKRLPVAGTLLNAAIFTPLLVVAPGAQPGTTLLLLAIAFVALLLQNQLLHERADLREDERAGARTTARALGERGTRAAVLLLGAAGLALALPLTSSTASATTVAAVLGAVTLLALVDRGEPAARRARHRWLALAGGALLYLVTR
jgi:4-hydroxybenzoate polyprenyltransferase